MKRTKLTQELISNIIEFYKSKPMSLGVLCEKFEICQPTAAKILKMSNIRQYTREQMYNPRIDEKYFENIDNEVKAYFVGLIIADGNIYDPKNSNRTGSKWTSITLTEEDAYMLQRFRDEVKVDTKISYDGRGSAYIAVRSDKIAEDLINIGIVPRKSFITRFPFEIDKKYYRHLIRGIIDGDGSVQAYEHYTEKDNRNRFNHKICCCGTHRLMQEIVNVIRENINIKDDIKVYDYKNRQLSEFKIGNIEDMYKFGNWLYDGATVYLKRKKEKFDYFVEHYKNNGL